MEIKKKKKILSEQFLLPRSEISNIFSKEIDLNKGKNYLAENNWTYTKNICGISTPTVQTGSIFIRSQIFLFEDYLKRCMCRIPLNYTYHDEVLV